jgi:hypothetical protein
VDVHYDEGVAIRIGPEPCVGIREDVGEGSAGERISQPLSRVNLKVPGADLFGLTEGSQPQRSRFFLGSPFQTRADFQISLPRQSYGHPVASARLQNCVATRSGERRGAAAYEPSQPSSPGTMVQ